MPLFSLSVSSQINFYHTGKFIIVNDWRLWPIQTMITKFSELFWCKAYSAGEKSKTEWALGVWSAKLHCSEGAEQNHASAPEKGANATWQISAVFLIQFSVSIHFLQSWAIYLSLRYDLCISDNFQDTVVVFPDCRCWRLSQARRSAAHFPSIPIWFIPEQSYFRHWQVATLKY